MGKHKIIFAKRVEQMLVRHMEFLTRVRIPAAKQFYNEFKDSLSRMGENPYRFPTEKDLNFPARQ